MENKYEILQILILILGGIIILILFIYPNKTFLSEKVEETNVIYENLSYEDKEFAMRLIENTKPEYLEFTEKIIFTYETPKAQKGRCGANYQKSNKIIIDMKHDKNWIEIILCHELLHDFIPVQDGSNHTETRHWVIQDIAKTNVCYKNQ